jgi:hypothetical protein
VSHKGLKSLLLLSTSVFLFALWMISAFYARSHYQNIASVDPLAMINVLFPDFWIILSIFALVCIATFYLEASTKWLHLSLLVQLSLMLFFTPFLLSGFSWSPDSLWHGGVANYISEILSGSTLTLSNYAQSYPFSFIVTYCMVQVLGVDIFTYTLYIYPVVSIITISTLSYTFAARVLNPRMAFASMLITLPAWHYFEPHVSPLSTGTILTLTSLTLLTVKGIRGRALSFLSITVLTLTHPISPLMLGVFLTIVVLVSRLFRQARFYSQSTFVLQALASTSVLFFLAILWFSWSLFQAMSIYVGVRNAVLNFFSFGFIKRLEYASEWTLAGQSFIYSEIHRLSLAVYAVFLFFILILLILDLRQAKFAFNVGIILSFAAIAYAASAYLFFLASGERFLLGRGLIYYIFIGSMCIILLIHKYLDNRILKGALIAGLIYFLIFSFPIISYSKEAYNTFTPSSGSGLSFIAHRINLSEFSISMSSDQQLASYVNLSKNLKLSSFPPKINNVTPEFIVLRINSYYSYSMRYDMSFHNNTFTRLRKILEESPSYNRIYSNSKFEIYD